MEPTEKKISFGFSRISKKPTLLNKLEEQKVELIDCLEGQNIKIKDAVEVDERPLVIPLKENKKNLLDRIKEVQRKAKSEAIKTEVQDTRPDSDLTIDELAARELIRDAKNKLTNSGSSKHDLTLPLKEGQEGLPPEGEAESTLEDYEKIPISDYGLALLRGMGWKEGIGIGKNPSRTAPVVAPELRPKGLGLGATKMITDELPKEVIHDKDGNALILKKGALAKIIAGSHKGQYCQVQGLDEESARVIVLTAPKGETLTVNEFLLLLVTKEEYTKFSKVLNTTKFEEYTEKERKREIFPESTGRIPTPDSSNISQSNSKSKQMQEITTQSRNTESSHSRKSDSDSDSSYESHSEKYNKIHKRKDKKRHRDRSRSPPSFRYKNGKKSSKHRHRSSSSDSEYEERRRERSRHMKEKKEKKNKR